MKLSTMVNCPYCGFKNEITVQKSRGRELRNCDFDGGGCDGTFVVEYSAKLTTTPKRIEGEEKYAADRKTTAPTLKVTKITVHHVAGNPPAVIAFQDGRARLGEIPPGGRFSFGGIDWVKLNSGTDTALCLSADCVTYKAFDESNCNDWRGSTLRQWLNNDFLQHICEQEAHKHGDKPDAPEPLKTIISDLTADDGMTDYGIVEDYIALLTCDLYRIFRNLIPPVDNWYWTLTPWSCHPDFSHGVRRVHTSGVLTSSHAFHGHFGVRPLINLSSEIFVSTVEGTQ